MRVLLDECVPARLAYELPGHDITTAVRMGWSGLDDARLLQNAEHEFEVFLTVDQALEEQARPSEIAIVTISSRSNSIHALRPLIPAVLNALETIKPGERLRIGR